MGLANSSFAHDAKASRRDPGAMILHRLDPETAFRKALVWVVLAVGLVLASGFPVLAAVEASPPRVVDPASDSYQDAFTRLVRSWRAGDRKALAAMVHPDGLKVTHRGGERAVTYSPDQAFYYFRNRFQNTRTGSFTLARIQRNPQADRVHALATWVFEGPRGSQTTRLVLVLSRSQDHWFLSEITTIK